MQDKPELKLTPSQRRRLRRKTLKSIKNPDIEEQNKNPTISETKQIKKDYRNRPTLNLKIHLNENLPKIHDKSAIFKELTKCLHFCKDEIKNIKMERKSDAEAVQKSRDDVKAAREAKKLAKQAKKNGLSDIKSAAVHDDKVKVSKNPAEKPAEKVKKCNKISIDEVDRPEIGNMQDTFQLLNVLKTKLKTASQNDQEIGDVSVAENLTVNDVVNTLKDIVNVAKDVENVTAIVQAMHVKKVNY